MPRVSSSGLVSIHLFTHPLAYLPRLRHPAPLSGRGQRVATSLHDGLFDESVQSYSNRLYNGTFYHRWAPTIFAPLLSDSLPKRHVQPMLAMLTDPSTFCVQDDNRSSAVLFRVVANRAGTAADGEQTTGASDTCLQDTLLQVYDLAGYEGIVSSSPSSRDSVALLWYRSASLGDNTLVTNASAPADPSYEPHGTEGFCSSAPFPGSVPLTLWTRPGHSMTCGSEACATEAAHQGLQQRRTPLCHVLPASDASTFPCRFALPSMGRRDPAFFDNLYWRGRIWQPQQFLTWAALLRQRGHKDTVAPRLDLVSKAQALFTRQLSLFGQINENVNGVLGVGSDSVRADSYYHWGALGAFMALVEAGHYPSPILLGERPANSSDCGATC